MPSWHYVWFDIVEQVLVLLGEIFGPLLELAWLGGLGAPLWLVASEIVAVVIDEVAVNHLEQLLDGGSLFPLEWKCEPIVIDPHTIVEEGLGQIL